MRNINIVPISANPVARGIFYLLGIFGFIGAIAAFGALHDWNRDVATLVMSGFWTGMGLLLTLRWRGGYGIFGVPILLFAGFIFFSGLYDVLFG